MNLSTMPLTLQDHELIHYCSQFLEQHHLPAKRFVATALRTTSGDVIAALNIRAYLGRASVCAEPIALSHTFGDSSLKPETLVTICYPGFITTPCGICRELLIDYYPELMIIIADGHETKKCFIRDMMPMKFYGTSKTSFNHITPREKHA